MTRAWDFSKRVCDVGSGVIFQCNIIFGLFSFQKKNIIRDSAWGVKFFQQTRKVEIKITPCFGLPGSRYESNIYIYIYKMVRHPRRTIKTINFHNGR